MSTSSILESFRRFLSSLGIRPAAAAAAVVADPAPLASATAKRAAETTPAPLSSPAPLAAAAARAASAAPTAAPVPPIAPVLTAEPVATVAHVAVAQVAGIRQPAPWQPAASQPAIAKAAAPQAPAAQPAAAVAAPATVKPMRSLEEVRADLARMRESARLRHARLVAERHTNFAPTDFMEMPGFLPVQREPEPAFAATTYLDFGTLAPHGAR